MKDQKNELSREILMELNLGAVYEFPELYSFPGVVIASLDNGKFTRHLCDPNKEAYYLVRYLSTGYSDNVFAVASDMKVFYVIYRIDLLGSGPPAFVLDVEAYEYQEPVLSLVRQAHELQFPTI